jgi:hypothetical protein
MIGRHYPGSFSAAGRATPPSGDTAWRPPGTLLGKSAAERCCSSMLRSTSFSFLAYARAQSC